MSTFTNLQAGMHVMACPRDGLPMKQIQSGAISRSGCELARSMSCKILL